MHNNLCVLSFLLKKKQTLTSTPHSHKLNLIHSHEQIQQPLTTWGSWRLDTPWQKKYGVKPQAGVVNIIDVPMGYPGRFDTWEELTK